MRIKEAAAAANLTEKAIRLYEERGLITPTVTEKNGRQFRDYNEETVRRLQTVAALRRAFFSLDQIAQMLESPDNIPTVFASYRADIASNYSALKPLLDRASSLDAEALPTVEAVSEAMTRPDETDHAEALPSFHFRVWNEEMSRDEREAAYLRCQKYMQSWGRFYSVTLFWDGICSFLCRNRRRIFTTLAVVILVFLALYYVPFPVYVNETVTGYALHPGESLEQSSTDLWLSMTSDELAAYDTSSMPYPDEIIPREISLHGFALYYLFRDDVFEGYLDIEGYTMRETYEDDYIYIRELLEADPTRNDRRRVRFSVERGVEYRAWGTNVLQYPENRPAPYLNDTYTQAIRFITLTKNRMSCAIGLPLSDYAYYPTRDMLEFHWPWDDDMIVFSLDSSVQSADDAVCVYWEEFWKPQYAAVQRNKERTAELRKAAEGSA